MAAMPRRYYNSIISFDLFSARMDMQFATALLNIACLVLLLVLNDTLDANIYPRFSIPIASGKRRHELWH